jgi:isocitrate lyase
MAGKVLVSTQEHIDRLVAARLQCDIMGAETIIVARTDAESATLLDSNVDPRDHAFIIGATNPDIASLNDTIAAAEAKGVAGPALLRTMVGWEEKARLLTYGQAVEKAITASHPIHTDKLVAEWRAKSKGLSNAQARTVAKSMGFEPFWCWEKPRTREVCSYLSFFFLFVDSSN